MVPAALAQVAAHQVLETRVLEVLVALGLSLAHCQEVALDLKATIATTLVLVLRVLVTQTHQMVVVPDLLLVYRPRMEQMADRMASVP